jgi:LacI family transcriptional regulator
MLSDHILEGPRVLFDNRKAVTDIVGYLSGRGHRRIGYIGGPEELEVSRVRLAGFNTAVAELGLESGPGHVTDGRFTVTGGSAAMAELLDRVEVTAVVTANDLMAIGAMRHLLASGLSVPDDVSVVGLDDILIAEYGPVPLTTMKVPTYDIGRMGASLLLEALGDTEPEDIRLDGKIIERDSVATLGPGR